MLLYVWTSGNRSVRHDLPIMQVGVARSIVVSSEAIPRASQRGLW
jgi:hypothetical protein